jgi:hypothetical protein
MSELKNRQQIIDSHEALNSSLDKSCDATGDQMANSLHEQAGNAAFPGKLSERCQAVNRNHLILKHFFAPLGQNRAPMARPRPRPQKNARLRQEPGAYHRHGD